MSSEHGEITARYSASPRRHRGDPQPPRGPGPPRPPRLFRGDRRCGPYGADIGLAHTSIHISCVGTHVRGRESRGNCRLPPLAPTLPTPPQIRRCANPHPSLTGRPSSTRALIFGPSVHRGAPPRCPPRCPPSRVYRGTLPKCPARHTTPMIHPSAISSDRCCCSCCACCACCACCCCACCHRRRRRRRRCCCCCSSSCPCY